MKNPHPLKSEKGGFQRALEDHWEVSEVIVGPGPLGGRHGGSQESLWRVPGRSLGRLWVSYLISVRILGGAVWRAGGRPMAAFMQKAINIAMRMSYARARWRGGRIIEFFKGKGDRVSLTI